MGEQFKKRLGWILVTLKKGKTPGSKNLPISLHLNKLML